MLSKICQDYIHNNLELCRQAEMELVAEMALSRAAGAVDLAYMQGQITASEYVAWHAEMRKAREARYQEIRQMVEVHKA